MRSEYELLVKVVSDFDGRLLTIKGWSVTLSLAALVLGFQHGHYELFGLASAVVVGGALFLLAVTGVGPLGLMEP